MSTNAVLLVDAIASDNESYLKLSTDRDRRPRP